MSQIYISEVDMGYGGQNLVIGKYNAKYNAGDSGGRGYNYYCYVFYNNGKNYEFRLNDYDNGQTISLEVFKPIVGSLNFID